jgi:hypothetical protein
MIMHLSLAHNKHNIKLVNLCNIKSATNLKIMVSLYFR